MSAVVDEHQALSFGVVEGEGEAAVLFVYVADGDAAGAEVRVPPVEGGAAVDAQAGAGDGVVAAAFLGTSQSKKVRSVPGLALPSA